MQVFALMLAISLVQLPYRQAPEQLLMPIYYKSVSAVVARCVSSCEYQPSHARCIESTEHTFLAQSAFDAFEGVAINNHTGDHPKLLKAPFDEPAALQARSEWAKHLDVSESVVSSAGIKLVLIPPGEFEMGATEAEVKLMMRQDPDDSRDWYSRQTPQHRVQISRPFYLSAYEITQEQFQRIAGRNPSEFASTGTLKTRVAGMDTSRLPVDNVSWYDAVEFCNQLSKADGRKAYYRFSEVKLYEGEDRGIEDAIVEIEGGNGYRLPTEAEWEYACRAGTTTLYHFGQVYGGNVANVNNYAAPKENKFAGRTMTVGSFKPNSFGLFDMHGNVSEWCWDWLGEKYYSESPVANPTGPSPPTRRLAKRINRGGAHMVMSIHATCATRSAQAPQIRTFSNGMRVACDAP